MPIAKASFGLSSINIIVHPNDTLDAIFRRLKLNLADLASLRALPGLKTRLDSLRPGESLHFMHRDGSLVGLERRLNEEQTLKVVRDESGLKADVLQNPLESRPRTLHAAINSSLFEAVENAGATTRPPWRWRTSSAGTSISCWISSRATRSWSAIRSYTRTAST